MTELDSKPIEERLEIYRREPIRGDAITVTFRGKEAVVEVVGDAVAELALDATALLDEVLRLRREVTHLKMEAWEQADLIAEVQRLRGLLVRVASKVGEELPWFLGATGTPERAEGEALLREFRAPVVADREGE